MALTREHLAWGGLTGKHEESHWNPTRLNDDRMALAREAPALKRQDWQGWMPCQVVRYYAHEVPALPPGYGAMLCVPAVPWPLQSTSKRPAFLARCSKLPNWPWPDQNE